MLISDTAHLTLLTLIMMRMSGFILLNPILGRKNIPAIVKAGFIMVLTFTIYAFFEGEAFDIESPVEYAFLLLKEFAAGYTVGYIVDLFLMIISFGGHIIDFQLGLSMAKVYDPQTNAQMPITGSLFQAYLMLLFFAVDGHLALIKILITSADIVPYGGIVITQGLAQRVIDIFLQCLEMGMSFSLPILAAEFLVEMGIGILNKVVPQISIFVINIQLKIIVGFGLLIILFSPLSDYLDKIITTMINTVQGILTFL